MGKKLVIVESPHKAKTIERYLGKKDYQVVASKGHIRDLEIGNKDNHIGVEINNDFRPLWAIDNNKKSTVEYIKKCASTATEIYLATDPDREGEAISWHLAEVLNLDASITKRLEFHEVTYHAILNAINNPRTINMDLVHAQEARRIIDRILGFKLSNLVKKKIGAASAGRVQSVVTRLVVERQNEVDNFVPKQYYIVNGSIKVDNKTINVSIVDNEKKDIQFETKEEALKAIEEIKLVNISFISSTVETKTRASKPVYTTSSMQQDASNLLKFDSKKTMKIAQQLYEGLDLGEGQTGLITYMRTDSIRITPEFINKTKTYIKDNYGENYVGVAKVFNSKDNVQDAHEGIRPTDLSITPQKLNEVAQKSKKVNKDHEKLYTMIYNREVASMMKDEIYEKEDVLLQAGKYNLLASGEKTVFDGFSKVLKGVDRVPLPTKITSESKISYNKLNEKESKTKGPSLYTEATLIAQMEKDGIGRPSTYATTLDTIKDHGYVKVEKNFYHATETGKLLVNKLIESFEEYVDITYTANMETSLDEIAGGSKQKTPYLREFYDRFEVLLKKAESEMEETQALIIENLPTLGTCPDCGNNLVYRNGKNGMFIACNGYPKCKYTTSLEKPESEEVCPKCGTGKLLIKKSSYGQFYGCSNYPNCNYIKQIEKKKFFKKGKVNYQNH